MLLAIAALLIGLIFLVWSSDRFIAGAIGLTKILGISPLIVGVVIIGFGTSAPEIVVSILAALDHAPALALGNAYGSNIANIGLILGLSALIKPIAVPKTARKKAWILLGLCLVAFAQLANSYLSRLESLLLIFILAAFLWWNLQLAKRSPEDAQQELDELEDSAEMGLKASILWMLLGFGLLVLSSRVLVWGAVRIATLLGVSDLIIGLTIVALGTSLPELAASLSAIRKGEGDMALGNVLGSNVFNTLAVVGAAGLIQPIRLDSLILWRDLPVMSLFTLILLLFCLIPRRKKLEAQMGSQIGGSVSRQEMTQSAAQMGSFAGLLFLLIYLAYNGYLIYSAL